MFESGFWLVFCVVLDSRGTVSHSLFQSVMFICTLLRSISHLTCKLDQELNPIFSTFSCFNVIHICFSFPSHRKSVVRTFTSCSWQQLCSPSPSPGFVFQRQKAARSMILQRNSEEQREFRCTIRPDSTPLPDCCSEPRRQMICSFYSQQNESPNYNYYFVVDQVWFNSLCLVGSVKHMRPSNQSQPKLQPLSIPYKGDIYWDIYLKHGWIGWIVHS